jgi:hypothetical protein
VLLRLKILNTNLISSRYSLLSPPCETCDSLKGKLFHGTKENTELKHVVAYLTSHLERTVVSEKIIEDDLSRVEESATKSVYNLGVNFERCEGKDVKSATKFVLSSNYHNIEEAIKSTKTHYPSRPKSSFNPKREVRKEILKLREGAFVCIFCGCAGHLDEFCFCRKRIEKRRFDYVRNSYRDEFIDFLHRSHSRASSRFSHGPNHHSYGFVSLETSFVPTCFGYGPRLHRVIVFRVGPIFLLEGLTLTLSPDTWTIHIFPVVIHVPLVQMVKCKGMLRHTLIVWLSAGFL